MSKSMLRSSAPTFLIGVSFFGLFLAGMLAFYPPIMRDSFPWRKPAIGSVFGSICILGVLAVFFPKQCSGVFDFGKEEVDGRPSVSTFAFHGTSSAVRGHHPDCENFSAHVFRIGNRTFCAACTGLLLGGLLALVGTFLYFFSNWQIEQGSSLMIWMGILGVGFGFFQFKFRTFARLFLNTSFVLGTFLILVGADELAGNVTVDLFLIALTLLWLFTRISLSEWDHRRICYACKVATCEFVDTRKRVG